MVGFRDSRGLSVGLICLGTILGWVRVVHSSEEESQLMHQLLSHSYNNLVRPRGEGTNGTLKVKIGMRLSQLLDIVSITHSESRCIL